jgi:hypothetical protein
MCSHDPTYIHIIGVFERLKRLYDMMHHDKWHRNDVVNIQRKCYADVVYAAMAGRFGCHV